MLREFFVAQLISEIRGGGIEIYVIFYVIIVSRHRLNSFVATKFTIRRFFLFAIIIIV